jgi:hypothetical protein
MERRVSSTGYLDFTESGILLVLTLFTLHLNSFDMVTRAIDRVLEDYGGLEFEKEAVCPECLQLAIVTQAEMLSWNEVVREAELGRPQIRCGIGHQVDTSLVSGKVVTTLSTNPIQHIEAELERAQFTSTVPVTQLMQSVVLIALWDQTSQTMTKAGSGFIVDPSRGLIVTASHTLIRMSAEEGRFGEYYFGLKQAKVLIGILPNTEPNSKGPSAAVFRYFAQIVQDDVANMDACVLKIRTRLERDVTDSGSGVIGNHEIPLLDKRDFRRQGLQSLNIALHSEVEEEIRLIGFNQGGEGILPPGSRLHRDIDFVPGHIIKNFKVQEPIFKDFEVQEKIVKGKRNFWPRHELVAFCPTIGGHSGGPCVNKMGEVIGILSRADGGQQRAYLVPSTEFMSLVEKARKSVERPPSSLMF